MAKDRMPVESAGQELYSGEDFAGALDCRDQIANGLLQRSGTALAESYIALEEHKLRIARGGSKVARVLNRFGLLLPKELKGNLEIARAQINNALTMKVLAEELREQFGVSDGGHDEPGSPQQ
jgi:hypothetical protein